MLPFALTFLLSASTAALAAPTCPLLGTSFPPVVNLASSSIIQSATKNLANAINQALSSGHTTHGPFENTNTSFSIQIFSTHSSQPLFDFHHTSPDVANGTVGTKQVNADSVYRVGSVTKLLAVYAFLAEAGDEEWNDPVTKYVPELKSAQKEHLHDLVNYIQWDEVTVGSLASQLSGIGRDYALGDFLADALFDVDLTQFGFPALNASDVLTCTDVAADNCTRQKILAGFTKSRPVFASFTTPIYSNMAFLLLTYAFEGMTHKDLGSVLEQRIFKALNMTKSSYKLPTDASNAVIPVDVISSWWNADTGEEWAAGSAYATVNDLTKLGKSILQSTILDPSQTRRWLKPHTHTARTSMSIGAPWEIFRYDNPSENRLIDVYTKSGDIGAYSALVSLIPEYDIGWNIIAASPISSAATNNVGLISELIADTFLAELENAGREAAASRFAGTYTNSATNSTIVLSTKDDLPGLHLDVWTSKGFDLFQPLAFVGGSTPNVVLYPTNVFHKTQYAFRADFEFEPSPDDGPFSWNCLNNWVSMDGMRYGGISLDDFMFEIGEDGNAKSLQPRSLRTTLTRQK